MKKKRVVFYIRSDINYTRRNDIEIVAGLFLKITFSLVIKFLVLIWFSFWRPSGHYKLHYVMFFINCFCVEVKMRFFLWQLVPFILSIHITMFVHWFNQLHFSTHIFFSPSLLCRLCIWIVSIIAVFGVDHLIEFLTRTNSRFLFRRCIPVDTGQTSPSPSTSDVVKREAQREI